MEVKDCVAIVTGGANGIGKAICRSFAAAGARHVIVADVDEHAARQLASEIHGSSIRCDVSRESDIQQAVELADKTCGGVDIFVSNAGITMKGGVEVPDEDWQRLWDVNVMAHVYASRAVLPQMLKREKGYLVQVSSAAGLLTEIGSAPYSVTKHAVVAFAEWLSVHYQKQGIRVSCVCPAGVATDFLDLEDPVHQFLHVTSVTPEHVAECLLQAMQYEQFLVLPHAAVGEFFAYKTQDYDRWLKNFARINEKLQKKIKKLREEGQQPKEN
ncbi:SDR family oxidoreductase [Planctomicrobium piriforme]|uniref:NAD(P)-dependent dehydrogenase, short-chain alcohol dehydrogenase family n=1 Tax=Planctomicrobium piriforme TaxID=1576369 RepID=A0A1I3J1B4_9PLAN|nr:SDR family oxidoreductase [Planctomicrobium piriforme]SFI53980.1 NAD(P)-dependent dehydrogenase, short-chain alcohol dehydrogenase family [Planctomicrobium piriforme]